MTLSLSVGSLPSRAIRLASTSGGVRRIAVAGTASLDEGEGIVTSVYNAIEKFGRSLMSFAFNALKNIFTFSWARLWQQIVGGVRALINFNWNITDAQIDEQIKQAEIGLAAARGSLAGQSLGFAICGLVPAATIAVFNEPLALYMMTELGEEAAEEIAGSLANLVSLQVRQTSKKAFFQLFRNYRTLFRESAIGFARVLVQFGILDKAAVDKVNKNRNEPWSIASALEDSLDSIKDPEDKAYAEEFWDEFGDSCIEAGYIIASSADSFFAQQKIANLSQFGSERIIEIQPIRDADEDNT